MRKAGSTRGRVAVQSLLVFAFWKSKLSSLSISEALAGISAHNVKDVKYALLRREAAYPAVSPPSTGIAAPLMNEASSLAR